MAPRGGDFIFHLVQSRRSFRTFVLCCRCSTVIKILRISRLLWKWNFMNEKICRDSTFNLYFPLMMTEQTLLSAHMEPEQSKYKMFSQNTNVIMKAECDVYQWWLAWPYGLSKSTSDTLWAQKIFDLEDTDSSHIVDVSLCYYCKARCHLFAHGALLL